MGFYLNNIADVYRKEKNYVKAMEVYNRSLQIISVSIKQTLSQTVF
jgi:hypothetical protein